MVTFRGIKAEKVYSRVFAIIERRLHRNLARARFVVRYISLYLRKRWLCRRAQRTFVVISLIEHVGDIVACEPVARYVREQYPDAYIFWCLRRPYRELVAHNPSIDGILTVTCLTEWVHLARSGVFDVVVDLHLSGRACALCGLPLLKTGKSAEISFDNYYTFGSLLAVFSRSAGLPKLEGAPCIYIPSEAVRAIDARALPDNFMVVHCLSNERCRDWTAEKWKGLLESIITRFNIHVIEIGLTPIVKQLSLPVYHDLTRTVSLLEGAELIRRAKLFVGVDSGFAHIANAVGTYGVILIGRYLNFSRYMPYSGSYATGENAQIIYADGVLSDMAIEPVFGAVSRRLASITLAEVDRLAM